MTKPVAVRRVLPTSPFKTRIEAPRKHFAVGDRVTHDAYGLGRAIGVEGGGDIAVLVDFGSRRERITPPYAAMFKL
ncbi:ATP-binding protein [Streptomyces rubellomurinus subsp. indigoferus]|nr:ATP-binding protein [Streptomyces rubellomurinus subsp. indigoferus]